MQTGASGAAEMVRELEAELAKDGDERRVAAVLVRLGSALEQLGDTERALMSLRRALALFDVHGDNRGMANALNCMSSILMTAGADAEARVALERATQLARVAGDESSEATSLNNLGLMDAKNGDWEAARERYARSMELLVLLGDDHRRATTTNNIGMLLESTGRYEEARATYEDALKLHDAVGDRTGMSGTLNNLGFLLERRGRPSTAILFYERALAVQVDLGDRRALIAVRENLASIYERLRRPVDAREQLRSIARLYEELGEKGSAARVLYDLAHHLSEAGLVGGAQEVLDAARRLAEEAGEIEALALVEMELGRTLSRLEHHAKAMRHGERALSLRLQAGGDVNVAAALDNLGLLYAAAGAFVARDEGCTYEPVTALDGKIASAVGVLPSGELLVSTANLGEANGVLFSEDEGVSWSELLPPVPQTSFFQLVVAGDLVLLTGTTAASGPSAPAVFISDDAGESFTNISSAYAAYPLVRATVFDGQDALLGGFNSQGAGIVLRSAPPYDAPVEEPVESEAGVPSEFPSEITHIAVLPTDGSIYALARLTSVLFRQPVGGAFQQVTNFQTGPTDCVFTKPDGSGLIGCGKEATDALGLYVESDDGLSWTPLIRFEDVSYRRCAAETGGGVACAGQYESSCDDGIDNDADQHPDCDDDECLGLCGAAEGEGEGVGEGDGSEGDGSEGDGNEGDDVGRREGEGSDGCASASFPMLLVLAAFACRRRYSAVGGTSSPR